MRRKNNWKPEIAKNPLNFLEGHLHCDVDTHRDLIMFVICIRLPHRVRLASL